MAFSSNLFSFFFDWSRTQTSTEPEASPTDINDEMDIEAPSPAIEAPSPAIESDNEGNTPLHSIIRTCQHIEEVYSFIKKNIKETTKMSRMINNHGQLPYDLIGTMPFAWRDLLRLKKYLLSVMISQRQLIAPTEILDFSEICQRYDAIPDNSLYHHLKLGVKAVNYVRSIIWESSTHLHTNSYRASLQDSIHDKVFQVRAGSAKSKDEMTAIRNLTQQYHAGNCYEYAVLAMDYLLNQNLSMPIECISLSNGDHAFVVIGKNTLGDLSNYNSWGHDAVICDAWAGDVYPVSHIENRLKDYRKVDQYRVITKFNPHYHKLASCTMALKSKITL